MQFRVLGPLEVDAGDGPLPLGGPKQRAILATLLVRANQVVSASALIDDVWGDALPENARNTLQTHVSNLRRTLGEGRLEGRPPGYLLVVGPGELDVTRFDSLFRDAKRALPADPSGAVVSLDAALSMWRGPALADVADQPSLVPEAARLEDLRLQALEARIEGLLATGSHARASNELEMLVARHPLRERLWALLMLSLYRESRQADALDAFRRAREILADELGIDPSPELVRLHDKILRQDPALDLRGEPLRGYRLLEKIGEGPHGAVFRAVQPRVGRDVAIKIFHRRIADDPEFARRFAHDAQAVSALEHPHIAPLYDYWRDPSGAYVVGRFLRGASLRALEDRGERFDRQRAERVVEQLMSALASAHREGVAHGRLRSSNVLLDEEENAYLTDFSIGDPEPPDTARDLRALESLARSLLGRDAGDIAIDAVHHDPPRPGPDGRNPYKGLRAFAETDAQDFFGRAALTKRLMARLREPGPGARFVAVVGPSGCGKSSVVRAGLVPEIRRGALGDGDPPFVTDMVPGTHPFDELETALLRVAVRDVPRLRDVLEEGSRGLLDAVDLVTPEGSELVLVIDQLEELFTLTATESERERFLGALRVASADEESRLRAVVTLRADFYDRPLGYARFADLLARRTEAVPPLTPDELEQAIRQPADRMGVTVDRGLIAEMIADVAHQPGALPLLQYALTELFELRDDSRMSIGAYQAIGRAAGALSGRAERVFEASDREGRDAIRQVFLRLVTLGEGRHDTRRRVTRSELDALEVDDDAIDTVLESFGRHRILAFDREPTTREATVEIAHEALLESWGRLHGWIDEAREDLRRERRLVRAAAEWQAAGRDDSFLLRGAQLDQVESWTTSTALAIGRPEREYVKSSLDERGREHDAEVRRREHESRIERRSLRRLHGLLAMFAVAALTAASLTILATEQRGRATREAAIATARELAAAALTNLDSDPERSILLALEAVQHARSTGSAVTPEVHDALHQAVISSRIVSTMPGVGSHMDWSPTGQTIATEAPDGSSVVEIRDAQTGAKITSFRGHRGDVTDVAYSPDGSMLATTGRDGRLLVRDVATGEVVAKVAGSGEVRSPTFDGEGRFVAAAWTDDASVYVLDTTTDRVAWRVRDLNGVSSVSFSPDGTRVAVSTVYSEGDGTASDIFVLDVGTTRRAPVEGLNGQHVVNVEWSPDGGLLAAGADEDVRIWDARTGGFLFAVRAHTAFVVDVDWLPDEERRLLVSAGGFDGKARVWKVGEAGLTEQMTFSSAAMTNVVDAAFSPDGTRVITANGSERPLLTVWDSSVAGNEEWANLNVDRFGETAFLPGRQLVASAGHGSVILWDVEDRLDPARLRSFDLPGHPWCCAQHVDVSADGSTIAISYWSGGVSVRDIATNEESFFVPAPLDEALEIDLSRDGSVLAVGIEGAVHIFDRSGQQVGSVREEEGYFIRRFQFSPDGRSLLTGAVRGPTENEDARIRVWDWDEGSVESDLRGASPDLLIFDPSGDLIAEAWNRTVRIWDTHTGSLVKTFPAQAGDIGALAFTTDGRRMATGASDGTIRILEVSSGLQRLVLRSPGNARSLSFSEDGSMLASVTDATLRIWALDLDDLLEIAGENVTRSLTEEECRQYLHVEAC